MNKKELRELAESLGAVLHTEGRRWIATFSDIPSRIHEGPVVFSGTRSDLSRQLLTVKEWEALRAARARRTADAESTEASG